ncbi:MAG: hypothetical protein ACRDQX_09085 [Pseudonocardiaceae bacterium]
MPVTVRTPWGEETHPTGADWDIDSHDRDLTVYDTPLAEAHSPLAVYPAGQWLRVMLGDDTPPATA